MSILTSLQGFGQIILQFYTSMGDYTYNFYSAYSRSILDIIHIFFYNSFYLLLGLTIALTLLFTLIAFYVYFKKPEAEKKLKLKDEELPFVTIQIPTFNELAAINCAKKCLDFDYPKNRYEIIMGDDSSDKSVSKRIDSFAIKNPQIKVTRRGLNIGYKPGNLNHMLKYTNGEYIVIFDSDFLPENDFLKRIIAPFLQEKDVAAVQARWKIKNFSQNLYSILGGTIPMFSHYIGLPFLKHFKSNGFIAGSAEAVRKKDLIELGGWTSGALTEDIDYSLRLTKAGKKIRYLETLECNCEAPFTLKDLSKQQMRWSYGVIIAFKKNFVPILKSKKATLRDSTNMFILVFGYCVTVFFFLLAVIGLLSIISGRPEPIIWSKMFAEIGRNLLVTSGFLIVSIITLAMSKNLKETPKMIFASLTIGLVIIYKVSIGVLKAIFNRPMMWFMLRKNGNEGEL